jgi:hypothetical protein
MGTRLRVPPVNAAVTTGEPSWETVLQVVSPRTHAPQTYERETHDCDGVCDSRRPDLEGWRPWSNVQRLA